MPAIYPTSFTQLPSWVRVVATGRPSLEKHFEHRAPHWIKPEHKNNKADLRFLKVGSRQGEDIVVEDGIKKDERVVTSGQMGLSPGVTVIENTTGTT